MRAVNLAVIPWNHRIEDAPSVAEDHDDLLVLHQLLAALASPYEVGTDITRYWEGWENFHWYWRLADFKVGRNPPEFTSQIDELTMIVVPCWSIVTPLTLLSVWLLLSKPRQQQTPVEPVPEAVA